MRIISICCGLTLLLCCSSPQNKDEFAYSLGGIGAFSEMINAGVKQLALSSPLPSKEMEALLPKAEEVAARHNVKVYRETDFLVTDLFPEDVTAGKEVLVLYQGTTLDQYLQLKESKATLVEAGAYDGNARQQIARSFGRMLSYTPKKINQLLAENTSFRSMTDFGVSASNVFLYYENLDAATAFYSDVIGLELLADYEMATIFRVAGESYLILVDAAEGMHTAEEPKTVALALLTRELDQWYQYLTSMKVPMRYHYNHKPGSAHDGFVAIDPEGYLLEFERFNQHPENEHFVPELNLNVDIATSPIAGPTQPLSFHATITWLYFKDVLAMQQFYEQVLGFEMIADQGWTKIYQVTNSSYIGLVDERRGMHQFTEDKGVTLSFILDDIDGWFEYVDANQVLELRSEKVETGPENKYRAFVGYDPEGYYLEFDVFYDHVDNEKLMQYLQGGQ